jgi:uncharacterized protein YjdB
MCNQKYFKKTAPIILSVAIAVAGTPVGVFAAEDVLVSDELTSEEVLVDDYQDAAAVTENDTEDDLSDGVQEELTGVEVELDSTAEVGVSDGYRYVYAGLTWAQYWASEGVYAADSTQSSSEADSKGEYDKGAFDTVTRATANHGLHRGSFQSIVVLYDESGNSYEISYWTSAGAVLVDGTTIQFNRGTITKPDGTTADMSHYEVLGIKYVPVKVKEADYEEFCKQYRVVENGQSVSGGYSEMQLASYMKTAEVTAQTNGLKEAVKTGNGFTFTKRSNGSSSGLKDEAQKTAQNIEVTVQVASGSYGEFLRVDLTGSGYGDLGSNMYAVRWDYYGNDSSYSNCIGSYGTKFASDNWMHKVNGIQLGLTDSLRCQLPTGTDGTGYWMITVYAMGYQDTQIKFQATEANIVKPEAEEVDVTALTELIAKADALKKTDYTTASWASLETELQEAKDEITAKNSQAAVNEAYSHLQAAINDLVKVKFAFEKKSISVTVGKSQTRTVVTENVTGKITYKSSNTKVATVDANGSVKAIGVGTATITATCGDYSASYTVKAAKVAFKTNSITMNINTTQSRPVTVEGTTGTVTYTSSDSSIVSVDKNGKVKANKTGTAKITAKCGNYSATMTVKVVKLAFEKSSISIVKGKSQTRTVVKQGVSGTVKYTSSNPSVATVDSNGRIKALKAGTTTITATCGNFKTTMKVTVKNK